MEQEKKSSWIKTRWSLLVSLLINAILALLLLQKCGGSQPGVKIEYVPVHDTVTITTERLVEKTKTVFVKDTLLKVDSVYVTNDGETFVELPMKWSQYKDTIKNDSSEVKIEIDYHGIEAGIDKVHLDYKYDKEIKTITLPPKKVGLVWSVGVGVGFGGHANINTVTFGYGPEIGIYGTIGIGGFIK